MNHDIFIRAKGRGLPQRRNSEFTKCHYHAPYPEPWVRSQAQKVSLACGYYLLGLSSECSPRIGAVQWNSEQIVAL